MSTDPRVLSGRPITILVAFVLAVHVLSVYWQVVSFPFVNYDDEPLVSANRALRDGFTSESIRWAFTTRADAGWIPLTWLSRIADVSLFGSDAGKHHLVNVLLHLANVLLLFQFFRNATGEAWKSAFAAALFAVHPLHVESVAWVTERKDVLFLFFWLLAAHAYLRYAERPGYLRYLAVLLAFALSLMSKPMAVTFPFVLLLLDAWPLGRLRFDGWRLAGSPSVERLRPFFEKVPLLLLSASIAAVTFHFQDDIGALAPLDEIPLHSRIGNAVLSYGAYLRNAIWPSGLSVFYPHPGNAIDRVAFGATLAFLAGTTAFAILQRIRRPYIATGWIWYIGTLVPVIGLVQAGGPAMADRFAYLPMVGIYLIVAWGVPELAGRVCIPSRVLAAIGFATIFLLAVQAERQAGYWSDSVTLFRHAIESTRDNWVAHANLGHALEREGRVEEAITHLRETLRIHPEQPETHVNLGVCLERTGNRSEAIFHYREAIRISPGNAVAWNNLGASLSAMGFLEEAIRHYETAVSIDPDYAEARGNLLSAKDSLARKK